MESWNTGKSTELYRIDGWGAGFFKINEQIKAKEIRLIDHEGNMVGVSTVAQGIKMAQDVGLDLIEVSPNANPPVCKISNFFFFPAQVL